MIAIGVGMIEYDWTLLAFSLVALLVSLYNLPRLCAKGPSVGFVGIFAVGGWLGLLGRYLYVMINEGDIYISLAAWAGIMSLACREIAILFTLKEPR